MLLSLVPVVFVSGQLLAAEYGSLPRFHEGSCFDPRSQKWETPLCKDLNQYMSRYLKVQSLDWTRVLPELEVLEADYPAFKETDDWHFVMVAVARRAVMSNERGIARVVLRYLPDTLYVQSRFGMLTKLSVHVLRQRSQEGAAQSGQLGFSQRKLNEMLAVEENRFLLEQLLYISLDLSILAALEKDLEHDLPWQKLCAAAATKGKKQEFVGMCFLTVLTAKDISSETKAVAALMLEERLCSGTDTTFCKMYEHIVRAYVADSGVPSEPH